MTLFSRPPRVCRRKDEVQEGLVRRQNALSHKGPLGNLRLWPLSLLCPGSGLGLGLSCVVLGDEGCSLRQCTLVVSRWSLGILGAPLTLTVTHTGFSSGPSFFRVTKSGLVLWSGWFCDETVGTVIDLGDDQDGDVSSCSFFAFHPIGYFRFSPKIPRSPNQKWPDGSHILGTETSNGAALKKKNNCP